MKTITINGGDHKRRSSLSVDSTSVQGNGGYVRLSDGEDPEERKAQKHVPNLSTWKTGKGIEYKRYDLIKNMVNEIANAFEEKLIRTQEPEAQRFYALISSGFESSPRKNDGFHVLIHESIVNLAAKGQSWDDPIKQEKAVKSLKRWLQFAKLSEILYALSTAYLSIYSYQDSLNPEWLGIVGALLLGQAGPVAVINYNGIDVEDAESAFRPVIQIGEQKLVRTTVSHAEKKDTIHATFNIDSEFDPEDPMFNSERVARFNRGFELWLEEKRNFKPREALSSANLKFNWLSFNGGNFVGGTGNWLIAGAFLAWLLSKLNPYWAGASYVIVPIGGVLLVILTKAGMEYYEVFTRESIEEAMRTFFTSDNPLAQVWRLFKASGLESGIQWITNGIARGFTLALGFGAVLDQAVGLLQSLSNVELSSKLKLTCMSIAGILGVHNTLGSRLKGAKRYLQPFTLDGPMPLLKIVVPNEKLYADEIKQVILTFSEKAKTAAWAGFHGATGGVPAAGMMILAGLSYPLSIGSGFAVFLLKFFSHYKAEIKHAIVTHAKEISDEKIEKKRELNKAKIRAAQEEKEKELKREVEIVIEQPPVTAAEDDSRDKNGNLKLTAKDIESLNWIFNLLDQAQRAQGRGGSLGQLIPGVSTDQLLIIMFLFWILFVTPQVCEFNTYLANTLGPLLKAINGLRESAGTPANEIKGKCATVSHFLNRQVAAFFHCIICPQGKPIQGISDQNWFQWFTGCWNYTKPETRRPAITQEEKHPRGCWSRLWSGRSHPAGVEAGPAAVRATCCFGV